MDGKRAIVGVFSYLDDTLDAIRYVQDGGYEYRVYSPVPVGEIEELTYPQKSNVRMISLAGALTGFCAGFFLAIMCSLDYPLRVSAKEIVSVPGFFVIGYECTILFGAIATFMALLHFCRIPDILRRVGYDPRFSSDKFGVVVGCETSDVDSMKEQLLKSGAEEVEVRDGL